MDKHCSVGGCNRPADRLGFCTLHYMRNRRHGSPTAGRTMRGAAIEFLREVASSATDDCISWPFNINKQTGYGLVKLDGRNMSAHRASLIIASGIEAPRNIHAAHMPEKCHNRTCVNPRHLRWATAQENELDKIKDKTFRSGETLHNAKLTNEQADMIRNIPGPAWAVALAFGVSQSVVHNVRSGKTYPNRDLV